MTKRSCSVCHQPEGKGEHELRPYGKGGAYVCFGCAFSTEENSKEGCRALPCGE